MIVKSSFDSEARCRWVGNLRPTREIQHFLHQLPHHSVIKEFVEVESGGKELSDRPVLQKQLICAVRPTILLRLKTFEVEQRCCFCFEPDEGQQHPVPSCCDAIMPTNLQLGIYALLNQEERRSCSTRTKNALAAARSRGVKLGNPKNLVEFNRSRKTRARQFADQHAPSDLGHCSRGRTLRDICAVLNESGMTTANGGLFHPVQVTRILRRSSHQEVLLPER